MSLILTATGLGYSSSSDRVSRRSTWWGPGRDVSGTRPARVEGRVGRCTTGHSARPTAIAAHRRGFDLPTQSLTTRRHVFDHRRRVAEHAPVHTLGRYRQMWRRLG